MCLVTFSKEESYSSKNKLVGFNNSPVWAYVEITKQCSHKCAWCYGGFNHNLSGDISISDFKIMCDKLKEIGVKQFTLSGGEPTEHPNFGELLEYASSLFEVHLATHGGWTQDFAPILAKFGVKQVQFNYQGKDRHDSIHQIEGSYDNLVINLKRCKEFGISTVGTVAVGAYNVHEVGAIFTELSDLGVDRLRVIETTGPGNLWKKKYTASEIFEISQAAAKDLGYWYSQSYDPEFEGHVGVPCISLARLYMYIDADMNLQFCGATINKTPIANCLVDGATDILKKYHDRITSMTRDRPYCAAREETKESVIQFHHKMGSFTP